MVGVVLILPMVGALLSGHTATLIAYGFVTALLGMAGGQAFRGVALALEGMGAAGGGLIYTMDILGTCLGGWQAGNIMIPCLGIHMTLVVAAGVAVVLFLLSFLAVGRRV